MLQFNAMGIRQPPVGSTTHPVLESRWRVPDWRIFASSSGCEINKPVEKVSGRQSLRTAASGSDGGISLLNIRIFPFPASPAVSNNLVICPLIFYEFVFKN